MLESIKSGVFSFNPEINEEDIEGISFQTINEYAVLAKDAYDNAGDIILKYSPGFRVQVRDLPKFKGRYFILFDDKSEKQYVSVRGTNNSVNAIEDGEYIKTKDKKTGIYMHKGFWESATETYNSVKKDLKKDYATFITGHSLGGAEAAILQLFLTEDGYNVAGTITFGQPKFTNEAGMKKYEDINILRVIDENDLVPLVPPVTLISDIHGMYRHIGPEIILLDGIYFCYLDKHAGKNLAATDLWRDLLKGEANIKDHYMVNIPPENRQRDRANPTP